MVSQGQVASLVAQFQGTWPRPPNDEERRALIDNFVREEVLYREGLALGLDRDDPVIRNRIKQKAEIIGEDALAVEPTDAELEALLAAHRAQFEIPATRPSNKSISIRPSGAPALMATWRRPSPG